MRIRMMFLLACLTLGSLTACKIDVASDGFAALATAMGTGIGEAVSKALVGEPEDDPDGEEMGEDGSAGS